jgi:ethanolamine transporter EutH
VLAFCQWLASTPWSVALHESIWVYPIVESVHVLTLCVFLGLVVIIDLRLLGVTMGSAPASEVVSRLEPWTLAGFIVMVVSGSLLFYAIPVKTYFNIFFRLKVVFLLLAGANTLVFHLTSYRKIHGWDLDPVPPLRARLTGALSLFLWAGIVVAGRMIAYNWFDKQL